MFCFYIMFWILIMIILYKYWGEIWIGKWFFNCEKFILNFILLVNIVLVCFWFLKIWILGNIKVWVIWIELGRVENKWLERRKEMVFNVFYLYRVYLN